MRGPAVAVLMFASPMLAWPALAAPQQQPAVPAASSTAVAPRSQAPAARRITLSAEGRAIAARIVGTADPRSSEIQAEIAAIRRQKQELISGTTVDVDRLAPLLRKEEGLQAEYRTRQNDRLIELLRALPDIDRVALLQSMTNPVRPDASGATPPATPAGR